VSPFLLRIAVLCCVLAGVAVAFPSVAPYLVGGASRTETQPQAEVAPTKPEPEKRIMLASGRKVAIDADKRGHYVTAATINGRAIEVMVDTGATTVALTAGTARRLGISPPESDYRATVSTANGTVKAAPVRLSAVRVGGIEVRDVAALVVPDSALAFNLLGLSFLNRLSRVEVGKGQLVLAE
jgi:aspartyl protease family protein